MAKTSFKAECLTQNNTANGSNATFVVRAEKQPAATPGQPPRIAALRTAQFNFDDDTGKNFTPGKTYTLTIE